MKDKKKMNNTTYDACMTGFLKLIQSDADALSVSCWSMEDETYADIDKKIRKKYKRLKKTMRNYKKFQKEFD